MGHQRLGRLPKTRQWAEVVKILAESPQETARMASATMLATQRALHDLAEHSALPYCYWLLTRLTWAARGQDFAGDAASFGVAVQGDDDLIGFIARLSEDVANTFRRSPGAGPFAELAVESLRATLLQAAGPERPSLFGASVDDVQRAVRGYATERGFSRLAHHFFGDFVARTLGYFLDREVGTHIGPAFGLSSIDDARDLTDALDLHARETARIVEAFAGEWYAKRNWLSGGEISREEAERFVGKAMAKIRGALVEEGQAA